MPARLAVPSDAELRSASLPSSVRLKGWVTTASGLAWTVAMVSPPGRPVQLTLTVLPALRPVIRKGEVSFPTPDWEPEENVQLGPDAAGLAAVAELEPSAAAPARVAAARPTAPPRVSAVRPRCRIREDLGTDEHFKDIAAPRV